MATLFFLSAGAYALEGYDVDPDTHLRMGRYRAPVPEDVPGGTTLDNSAAINLHANKRVIFIDVYPPTGLGPDPLDGSWITSESRHSIPGAVWLPEVGRGTLTADAEDYFQRNLARLTRNNLTQAIVFFCTSDCWQSWNASRRAIGWGYTAVHWYPLGTDGWLEAGKDLALAQPINFLDDTTPITSEFPPVARIFLIDQEDKTLEIGQVIFTAEQQGRYTVAVSIDGPDFEDQFLSMRPFRCLTKDSEWFCHLPYPYELSRTVSFEDLTELEYQLLFIWKSPRNFGIDAWNGVYYKLALQEDMTLRGSLLQGDLNVLADPPEPFSRPIDLNEFTDEGAGMRRYPSLIIRP